MPIPINFFIIQYNSGDKMNFLENLHPIIVGLLATLFTYLMTVIGASFVFFFKKTSNKILDLLMGIATGIMISASFWSLLSPAVEIEIKLNRLPFIVPTLGFFCGGIFVLLSDIFISKMNKVKEAHKKNILIVTAVTIHNIPEGFVVGVAVGSFFMGVPGLLLIDALIIAFGIGIQNLPEGACVAMPLLKTGVSKKKAFFIGQASGMVEPFAGVIGVIFAITIESMLPFFLSFAAGAMIAVVCSELIPDSFKDNKLLASIGMILGFILMMALDLALG